MTQAPSLKEALAPCPFCGSAHLESGGDDKLVGVRCLDCEATGPNHYITGKDWNIRSSVGVSSNAIDALEHARMFIENGVELGYIKMPDADTLDPAHETLGRIKAALATLQPSGERREAIVRLIGGFPTHPHDGNEQYVLHDAFPGDYDSRTAKIYELVDSLLASGLVQDEAGIRADEREKLRNRLDSYLNDFLCGMKEGWDDSVSGFNDAWDVVREVFDSESIRSARDGGEA